MFVYLIEINMGLRGICGIFMFLNFKKCGRSSFFGKSNGKRLFKFFIYCF